MQAFHCQCAFGTKIHRSSVDCYSPAEYHKCVVEEVVGLKNNENLLAFALIMLHLLMSMTPTMCVTP